MKNNRISRRKRDRYKKRYHSRKQKGRSRFGLSKKEMQKRVHELETYKIELEIQNHEMRKKEQELMILYERSRQFLNFAPFVTVLVGKDWTIKDLNREAIKLLSLCIDTGILKQKPLYLIIHKDSQDDFYFFRKEVTEKGFSQKEIKIKKQNSEEVNTMNCQGIPTDEGYLIMMVDLTETYKQRDKYRELSKRYETLIKVIPEAIAVVDLQGYITVVSETFLNMYHIEKFEDVIGKNMSDFIHPEDLPHLAYNFKKILKKPERYVAKHEYKAFDGKGEILYISAYSSLMRDNNGNIVGVIASIRDISQEKKYQEKIAENQRLLDMVINTVSIPIFYKNIDLKYVFCNEAFCKYIGKSFDELIGKTTFDIAPAELAYAYEKSDRELLKNQKPQEYETEIEKKTGERRHVLLKKEIFYDAQKRPKGIVGVVIDKTNEIEIQKNLMNAKIEADRVSKLKSEFLANTSHEIRTPLNGIQGFSYLLKETMKDINENRILFGNLFLKTVFKLNADTFTQSENDSIDEILKSSQSLLSKINELEEKSFLDKTRFEKIFSIQQLKDSFESCEENIKRTHESINIIFKSGEYLLHLVTNIVNLSRIEAGYEENKAQEVNIHDFMNSVFLSLEKVIPEKKCKFVLKNKIQSKDRCLVFDSVKVQQVLNNLVFNAFKFTEEGVVSMEYKIQNKEIEFIVRDTGIGMSEKEISSIFDRFYSGNNKATNPLRGTGLGLTISKRLIEIMGGQICVGSTEGKGSTFSFVIPYQEIQKKEEKEKIAPEEEMQHKHNKKTVLIVEDDEDSLNLLNHFLKKMNIKTILAKNAEEAMRLFKTHIDEIDLVLLDIRLPGKNGFHIVQEMREENKQVPVIAQTATIMQNNRKKLEELFDDYLEKPIDINLLKEMLNHYLE